MDVHAADTLIDFDKNTVYVKHARIMKLLNLIVLFPVILSASSKHRERDDATYSSSSSI